MNIFVLRPVMTMLPLLLAGCDVRAYQYHAAENFPELCLSRPADSHKGLFGTVAVYGGSRGMGGAVRLAAEAALYGGCGRVLAALDGNPAAVAAMRPEVMADDAGAVWAAYRETADVWVAGCGLAHGQEALSFLETLWADNGTVLVLDAGALTMLAAEPAGFAVRNGISVLTPHPGEAARLLGVSVAEVQADRPAAAKRLAERYRAWTVLKGKDTLIAAPDGGIRVNPSGNAGLATAGSGDVLAGLTGSLLAQGLPPVRAAAAAAWLHGAAADLLAEVHIGPAGLLAGELAEAVRWLRNRLAAV